jgi:hypothetical protein
MQKRTTKMEATPKINVIQISGSNLLPSWQAAGQRLRSVLAIVSRPELV